MFDWDEWFRDNSTCGIARDIYTRDEKAIKAAAKKHKRTEFGSTKGAVRFTDEWGMITARLNRIPVDMMLRLDVEMDKIMRVTRQELAIVRIDIQHQLDLCGERLAWKYWADEQLDKWIRGIQFGV